MKKTVLVMLAAVMTASCAAESASITVTRPAVEARTSSAESRASSDDEKFPAEGTFVSTSENFSGDYMPSITFNSDGTFVMKENLYEGMGEYRGVYEYDGNYYECTVTKINFSGYAGDDVENFSFLRFDVDNLILLDDLCGSSAKDVFRKSEDKRNDNSGSSSSSSSTGKSPFDAFRVTQGKSSGGSSDSTSSGKSSVDTSTVTSSGSIKPDQSLSKIQDTRYYVSSSDWFDEPYCPTLQLDPDGTFELTENLFEGMGHYTGTYEMDDINLTLTVKSTDFKGFAGDDVKEIRFEVMSDDVIQLMTDLCGSMKFDYWYLDIQQ